jgi:Tfp pilus assembly protein PilN
MLLTMLSARTPWSAIFSKLPVNIPMVSATSVRLPSLSVSSAGAAISLNSASNSFESEAKLLTKLSGFLISCAIPAVS